MHVDGTRCRRSRRCGAWRSSTPSLSSPEIGDGTSINPRQLMAYNMPSGAFDCRQVRRRGGITKAGNRQARRALIEGAWTYRMQARISRNCTSHRWPAKGHTGYRLEGASASLRAVSPAAAWVQENSCRHNCNRTRDDRVHLGNCPSGSTAANLVVGRSKCNSSRDEFGERRWTHEARTRRCSALPMTQAER